MMRSMTKASGIVLGALLCMSSARAAVIISDPLTGTGEFNGSTPAVDNYLSSDTWTSDPTYFSRGLSGTNVTTTGNRSVLNDGRQRNHDWGPELCPLDRQYLHALRNLQPGQRRLQRCVAQPGFCAQRCLCLDVFVKPRSMVAYQDQQRNRNRADVPRHDRERRFPPPQARVFFQTLRTRASSWIPPRLNGLCPGTRMAPSWEVPTSMRRAAIPRSRRSSSAGISLPLERCRTCHLLRSPNRPL